MKRFFSFVLLAFFVLGMAGCAETDKAVSNDEDDFVVLEASETYLLVSQMGEGGKALEGSQYSLPNYFDPSVKIEAGSVITIKHNGVALETYPMQFAKIYSVQYHDAKTGRTITVAPES